MTPSNDICPVCSYAGSAIYCECPSAEQRRTGVVPLDSLPAAWWNKMWADTTNRINEARDMVGQLITEVNNVLAAANINPQAACTDQLYQSINLIRQRLATATVAGSIVSSSDPNEVAVDANGKATVNCMGNATALTTTASTVVGAINELKSTYDCCISDLDTCTGSLGTGKAPNMHASANTTYGVGNATCYGHVKLSDTYDSVLSECSGVAASQYALATAYACLIACAGAPLGNTIGCALGTAAVGTASTAARSDHVHPLPTCVACSGLAYNLNMSNNASTVTYVVGRMTGSTQYCTYTTACLCVKYAGNAGTLGGYGASTDATANSIGQRNGSGYFKAVIFQDTWAAENINSYSSPKLVFKGNGDGYLRNTDPANVCVGCAHCACYAQHACWACCANYACCAGCADHAWAYYSKSGICVCLKYLSGGGAFGCTYHVCACSRSGGAALAIGTPGTCYGCCSGNISGHLISSTFMYIGCIVGSGLQSYCMPGIYLY